MRKIVLFFLFAMTTAAASPGFYEPWGKDSGLRAPPAKTEEPKISFATRVADAVIRFHQTVISPVDGPRSHFKPSSSQYMHLAMHRYGFVKGFLMGCDRLLREHDEEWVYRKVVVDGKTFQYDPANIDKYQ